MANLKNYEQILKDNDLEFISYFREDGRSHIVYKCKIHGEQTQRFDGFKMCKICSKEGVGEKLSQSLSESIEEIKKWVKENSTAEIMTSEYKNSKTDYWFRCGCGNGFLANMNDFKVSNKRQCTLCGIENRTKIKTYSFEDFNAKVSKYNKSKLIEVTRENNKPIFNLICCECGETYSMDSNTFYKSSTKTCQPCSVKIRSKNRVLSNEYVINYLESFGLTLLSEFYTTSKKIKVKCKCGKSFKSKFNTIKNSKYKVCKECSIKLEADKRTLSNEEFLERFKKLNSDEYDILNSYSKNINYIQVKHKICGGVYNIKPKTLLNKATICPYCNMSKGEDKISYFLKQNNIKFITQFRFDDCRNKNPLPFDFYLPDYNILLEYDGEYHYHIKPNKTIQRYMALRKNDMIKNKFCREKEGLKLVRIPYWEYKSINKILKYLLKI